MVQNYLIWIPQECQKHLCKSMRVWEDKFHNKLRIRYGIVIMDSAENVEVMKDLNSIILYLFQKAEQIPIGIFNFCVNLVIGKNRVKLDENNHLPIFPFMKSVIR